MIFYTFAILTLTTTTIKAKLNKIYLKKREGNYAKFQWPCTLGYLKIYDNILFFKFFLIWFNGIILLCL